MQFQSREPPSRPAGFQQTQVVSGSDAVKVTLNDCLACSGCVTSAETVLLEHQSIEELQVALADPQKTVIVSGEHRHSVASGALLSWSLCQGGNKASMLGLQHCSAAVMWGMWKLICVKLKGISNRDDKELTACAGSNGLLSFISPCFCLDPTHFYALLAVSPQSRASLAALHNMSPAETFRRLTHFLKGLGVRQVYDTSCSRDLALLEAAQEFCARYLAAHPQLATQQAQAASVTAQSGVQQQASGLPGPQPGSASDREQAAGAAQQQSLEPYHSKDEGTRQPAGHGTQVPAIANGWHQAPAPPPAASWQQPFPRLPRGASRPSQDASQGPPLPMLASACPGWVCYAEKTHGDYVLPYISTTKSPQVSTRWLHRPHTLCQT